MTITEYNEKKHIEDVRKQGLEEGRAEGRADELVSLVKEGFLPADVAAVRLNMSLDEFTNLLDGSAE